MTTCLISFGGNLGDPPATLQRAVQHLGSHPQIDVRACSRVRWTRPVGGPADQSEYLNAVLRVETSLPPPDLLEATQQIERQLGRTRGERWAARTIDLDLLLYGPQRVETPQLRLPHPRLCYRRFVLEPAVDVAGNMVHPDLGWSLATLLRHLDAADPYIAVTGLPECGQAKLVARVCSRGGHEAVHDPLAAPPLVTGWSAASEIESLGRRVAALTASRRRRPDSGRYVLSDFWCEQSVVWANLQGSSRERDRVASHWKALRGTTLQPQLVVVLNAHAAPRGAAGALAAAFQQYVRQTSPVPALHLAAEDQQWAETEILAAIAALQ